MPKRVDTQQLISWLTIGDPHLRKRATLTLGGLTPSDRLSLRPLSAALLSDDTDLLFWVVVALGRLRSRSRSTLSRLLRLANHSYLAVRQSTIAAIVAIAPGDERVRRAVFQALHDSSPFVRREALQAFISIPALTPEELAAIAAAANDPDDAVSRWSEIAIRNIGIKAAAGEARRTVRANGRG